MPRRVMTDDDSQAFRALLRRGLDQYGLTPGKVAPLAGARPTPEDLLGKRLGIQDPDYDPLGEAGYRSDKQIAKLVENALARPVQASRARLALFALMHSRGAARWRRRNGMAADAWYGELRALQRSRVPWAAVPLPPPKLPKPDERLVVSIHPAAVVSVADLIARTLYERSFLSKTEVPQAAATIARVIGQRRERWRQAFVHWLALGESFYDVGVVETAEKQVEGIELHRTQLVVQRRRDGKPPGREPTHTEFVQSLLEDAEATYVASGAARRRTKSRRPPATSTA